MNFKITTTKKHGEIFAIKEKFILEMNLLNSTILLFLNEAIGEDAGCKISEGHSKWNRFEEDGESFIYLHKIDLKTEEGKKIVIKGEKLIEIMQKIFTVIEEKKDAITELNYHLHYAPVDEYIIDNVTRDMLFRTTKTTRDYLDGIIHEIEGEKTDIEIKKIQHKKKAAYEFNKDEFGENETFIIHHIIGMFQSETEKKIRKIYTDTETMKDKIILTSFTAKTWNYMETVIMDGKEFEEMMDFIADKIYKENVDSRLAELCRLKKESEETKNELFDKYIFGKRADRKKISSFLQKNEATIFSAKAEYYGSNPDLSVEELEKIAKRGEEEGCNIGMGVALNPSTPLELRLKLTQSKWEEVANTALAYLILNNLVLDEKELLRFSKHSSATIRRVIAFDDNVTDEILSALENDEDEDVVEAAKAEIAARSNILENYKREE